MAIPISAEPVPLSVDTDGVIRVGKTRVTLDTVVAAFLEGSTAEEIVQQYPSLDLVDVYAVIGYYLRHRSEIESYLEQRQQEAQRLQEEIESRFPPHGIRARLMARRNREGR
jgi:uncharacterized protein (DUF433 family)